MTDGPQRSAVNLSFSLPSICAEEVEQGLIQIGLVPVAEIARQQLEVVPGVGIAAFGPVRSILLFAKVPWTQVRTLAADPSSRTSVKLAQIILRESFGTVARVLPNKLPPQAPDLAEMLGRADAALIIGDPALRIDPTRQPHAWLDLAAEWKVLTGLPFVFAAWAGKPRLPIAELADVTVASYRFGCRHLSEIVESESRKRQFAPDLTDRYLRHHLHYEIGPAENEGWAAFLALAGLSAAKVPA